jgi:hypothetical protein
MVKWNEENRKIRKVKLNEENRKTKGDRNKEVGYEGVEFERITL